MIIVRVYVSLMCFDLAATPPTIEADAKGLRETSTQILCIEVDKESERSERIRLGRWTTAILQTAIIGLYLIL